MRVHALFSSAFTTHKISFHKHLFHLQVLEVDLLAALRQTEKDLGTFHAVAPDRASDQHTLRTQHTMLPDRPLAEAEHQRLLQQVCLDEIHNLLC